MKKQEKIMIGVLLLILIIVIVVGVVLGNNKEKKQLASKGNTQNTENVENIDEIENKPVEEFVDILKDGTKKNKSSKLLETKTFDGLEIGDLQLTTKNNVSLILGTITNTSEEIKGEYPIDITLLDKEGNEIITIGAYIQELQPGQSAELNTSATFDFANAYNFTISK